VHGLQYDPAMWLINRAVATAALAAVVGCGGIVAGSTTTGDAGSGCSLGCGCMTLTITAAQACQMIAESAFESVTNGPTCEQVCPEGHNVECQLPQSFVTQVSALNSDASSISDGGVDCPSSPSTLTVMCGGLCP
jgi:hypothetical protein